MKTLLVCALSLALVACAAVVLHTDYPSAVRVVVGPGWGSGVVVASDRVLTAAHVVDSGDEYAVEGTDGERYPVDAVLWRGEGGTVYDMQRRVIGLAVGGARYGTGGTAVMVRLPRMICEGA